MKQTTKEAVSRLRSALTGTDAELAAAARECLPPILDLTDLALDRIRQLEIPLTDALRRLATYDRERPDAKRVAEAWGLPPIDGR